MDYTGKLELLETLVAIGESRGVEDAARRMQCAPEVLYARIAELEFVAGVPLVDRVSAEGALTMRGDELRSRAAPLLRALRGVLSATIEDAARLSGDLTVCFERGSCQPLLSRLVTRFAERHPLVRFQLHLVEARGDADLRGAPSFDVAVLVGAAPKLDGYRSRALIRGGAWGFYAAPVYLDARPEARLGSSQHDWLLDRRHAGLLGDRVTPRVIADDAGTLADLAVAGLGVAFLPRPIARPLESDGRLRRVLGRERLPSNGLSALYRSGSEATASAFLNYLVHSIAETPT